MQRIVLDVSTGEQSVVDYTPEEIAAVAARVAQEALRPDWEGFRLYCLGGVFAEDYPAIAQLIDTYTSFVIGIQYNNLELVNASLDRALAARGIPKATVEAIRAAMVTYHLA